MQLLGVVTDEQYERYLAAGLTGFLFPLADFSCDYVKTYTLSEIKAFRVNFPNAHCFVVMNKMLFQADLSSLLSTLKSLEEMNVTGILFYDTAILYTVKKERLKLPLYLYQTHFVTNTKTVQTYHSLGVTGAYISNEITLDEIKAIANQTNAFLMMLLVGYPVVAMSRRHLLTNYQKMIGSTYQNALTVEEPFSKQKYRLYESKEGTTFRYGKRLNNSIAYKPLENKIAYGILEQADFTSEMYEALIRAYHTFDQKKIDAIAGHNRGFLYRKTIYRVKKK